MVTALVPLAHDPVKRPDSTRAAEIPETSPFAGWTDADFAAFETLLHADTLTRYERRVARMSESQSEAEADHFARTADVILIGDEVLTRGEARERLAHPDTGDEFEPEEDPTDFPPDEGGGEEESTYQTDDRRSGLQFPETPW